MRVEQTSPVSESLLATLLANHRRFLSFLESRVGNREDAEEILQSAFVRSIQKAEEIAAPEHVVAWFYRLLRNAVIDHYRHRAAGERSLEGYAKQFPSHEPGPDPDMERVVCECVKDLIEVLKPEQAALIRDVDLGGTEIATVATSLGITSGNARVRLHRARAALREELERVCRTCATHGCLDCTCSTKASTNEKCDDGTPKHSCH